jgi:two-component system OmpR family sensor kinase
VARSRGVPRRWLPRSLRWRLAVWVAAVMVVSSAIVFVVVYINTGTQVQQQIDRDLAGDTGQLSQALKALKHPTVASIRASAASYVSALPYISTNTLFFVLMPGQPALSNEPELFGRNGGADRGAGAGARADAASSDAANLGSLRAPRLGFHTTHLAEAGKLRIYEQSVTAGGLTALIGAGEPESAVTRAQNGVARAFVLAGALSIALALIASYFAGARVTAPLRRMAAVAARVDSGDLEPRMELRPGSGEEVQVLGDAFNNMLDRLSVAFKGQREFVADASHELRTPLTVIRGQLELLAASASPGPDEISRVEHLVQAEIVRISRLVDDLLLLAQAEQRDFLRVEPIELAPFVDDLWNGLSLTADRRFELSPLPSGRLNADPDRLAQALRNLGRNAVEHTIVGSGVVRLEVSVAAPGRVRFTVRDNGPGIPAGQREYVFDRFHRTDPARSRENGGAGLGLAIVRAIAEAHAGEVTASDPGDDSELTGARIELVLPGYSGGTR